MRIYSGFSNELSGMNFLASTAGPSRIALRAGGLTHWVLAGLLAFSLSGCGDLSVEHDYPTHNGAEEESDGSVFDWLSLDLFGGDTNEDAQEAEGVEGEEGAQATPQSPTQSQAAQAKPISGLAVNADLWRAALDTLRFMPLASADPTGGTIITDWYNDPGNDKERVKINVVISGLDLRADALRVSLFREKWNNRRWVGVAASSRAERQMENIILTRAREYTIMRRDTR